MSVKDQMIGILRGGEAHRISFTFRGSGGGDIRIGPSNFALVADALANDRIAVVEGRFTTDIAMYSARADTARGSAATASRWYPTSSLRACASTATRRS